MRAKCWAQAANQCPLSHCGQLSYPLRLPGIISRALPARPPCGSDNRGTGLVRLDRAFFKAQSDQNLARFFLRAALAAFAFSECAARSGKISDAGLALANMASVHSGFSLSIISGSGFFFIAFYLRFVGAAQADNPHRRTGFGEDQSMKAVHRYNEMRKSGLRRGGWTVRSWLWSNRIQRRA